MIPKYRNRAIARIAIGYFLMFVALGVMGATDRSQHKQLGQAISVILGIVGFVVYSFGCAALAEAKGYSSAVAAGLIAVHLLCCCGLSALLPLVVLIALHDKTRDYGRHSWISKRLRWIK